MKKILLLIIIALTANNILLGQGQFTTQGNDFWLTYGSNYTYTSGTPYFRNSRRRNASCDSRFVRCGYIILLFVWR